MKKNRQERRKKALERRWMDLQTYTKRGMKEKADKAAEHVESLKRLLPLHITNEICGE